MLKSISGKPGSFEDTETGKIVSIVSEEEIYRLRLKTLIVCLADERDRRAKGRESPFDCFDMGNYVNPTCRTPSCVLGHYASRADLQSDFALHPSNGLVRVCKQDEPLNYDDIEVLLHFGITQMEADHLFSGGGCDEAETEDQAIEFIESFVAKKYG